MTTLWLSPLNGDPAFGDALVPRLLAAHAMLPPDGVRDALVPLLAASFDARPDDDDDDVARRRRSFERRLVRPVLAHVERRVRAREREGVSRGGRTRGKDTAEDLGFRDATDAARALATLHAANAFAIETRGEFVVAPSAFYSAALSDSLNLRAEYMAWIRDARVDEPTLARAAVAAARWRRGRRVGRRGRRGRRRKRRRRDSRGRDSRGRFRRAFVSVVPSSRGAGFVLSVRLRAHSRGEGSHLTGRGEFAEAPRDARQPRARRAPGGSRTTRRSKPGRAVPGDRGGSRTTPGRCARRPLHASLRGRENHSACVSSRTASRRRASTRAASRKNFSNSSSARCSTSTTKTRSVFDVDEDVRRRRRRRERRERRRRGKKSKSRMFAYDEESRFTGSTRRRRRTTRRSRDSVSSARRSASPYTTAWSSTSRCPPSRFAVWRTNDTSRRWKISANSPRA